MLPEKDTGLAITGSASQHTRPRKKRRSSISSAWVAFENLVRRSMGIVIGSHELTRVLLLTKSVDRIAGHLDHVIPATRLDENVRRAAVLSSGSHLEVQREVVKILLYLVSNHLIMDFDDLNPALYINDARAFVDACQRSGLTEPHVLAIIVKISLRSPTMTAVLDLLYEAAVNIEAVDLVRALLAADSRIDPNRPVCRIWWLCLPNSHKLSALGFALITGSVEFASSMLRAGADINCRSKEGLSPLMLAALSSPERGSLQLTQLLIQHGAPINEDNGPIALYLAIMKGSFRLINLLYESGANVSLTFSSENLPQLLGMVGRDIYGINTFYLGDLHYLTCLGLAASFSSEPFEGYWETFYEDTDDEDTALNLVKQILSLAGPGFDLDGKLKSDAMIHAAMRGYSKVILYLHRLGARINSKNAWLCPVYAAVDCHQVESCRLLLDLGGSAQADYRISKRHFACQLSPLHVAVSYNSLELTSLLIQSGVDINYLCEVKYSADEVGEGFRSQMGHTHRVGQKPVGCVSPLALAMISGYWEVALLLVDSGAALNSEYLFRAASAGQYQLTSQMLELKADTDQAVMDGESALHASIRNGHDLVSMRLLESGATTNKETLGLALKYGQVQTAAKLIKTRAQLTASDFAWAFRIPDESMLRYFLLSQPSDAFIGERSPDGRTFLENAILSRNLEVIRLALSLSAQAYDSGALCAAVLTTFQPCLTNMDEVLREILRRRELISKDSPFFDHVLEDTAVSIAAYYGRLDIIQQLRKPNGCGTNTAALPKPSFWVCKENTIWLDPEMSRDKDLSDCVGVSLIRLDISMLSMDYYSISPSSLGEWSDWHDPKRQLVSPLFLSIKCHNEPGIELLLDLGYKADGHSLRAAISEKISSSLILRLIEGCTDLNVVETFGMTDPRTPIYLASLLGNLDLVKVLLDVGADPNAGPWYARESTLCQLIESQRFDLVHVLLQHGINIRDIPPIRTWGDTALQVAAQKGHIGVMHNLLKYGADPNARGAIREGRSVIETAAYHGHLDGVQLLLRRGVITEGRGQMQYIFAIHAAAQAGHSAIVQLLKSHREWTAHDERILQDLEKYYNKPCCAFIHHGVDTEGEIAEILDCTRKAWEEYGITSITVIEIGADIQCKVRNYANGKYSDEETMTGEAQLPTEIDDIHQTEIDSMDEGGFTDAELSGGVDTSEVESESQVWSKVTEEGRNIQLGPHTEVEAEKERNQQILGDMLGEREASFVPVEWAW